MTSGSTHVTTLDQRQRIPREAIDDVVRQIVQQFRPERILLFGSYAYGDPAPDSDVDLLVVMATPLKHAEQAVRICQAIEYHFGLDLMVYTPEALARRLALDDLFVREIIERGTVLFERPDGFPHSAMR